MRRLNEFGQPIGEPLPDWSPPPLPTREQIEGIYCRLVPLDAQLHARPLYEVIARESDDGSWTYLPYGPFGSFEEYRIWATASAAAEDPLFFAIEDRCGHAPLGVASYLRIAPAAGSIEVGHIHYSSALKRSAVATEAMYLLMERAFALGYRRCEWKCDSLNAPSRAAAQRLGFQYEGIFRQAAVYKGRNRYTAWYSMLDSEWPRLRVAFERWLAADNFDAGRRQRTRLSGLTRDARGEL